MARKRASGPCGPHCFLFGGAGVRLLLVFFGGEGGGGGGTRKKRDFGGTDYRCLIGSVQVRGDRGFSFTRLSSFGASLLWRCGLAISMGLKPWRPSLFGGLNWSGRLQKTRLQVLKSRALSVFVDFCGLETVTMGKRHWQSMKSLLRNKVTRPLEARLAQFGLETGLTGLRPRARSQPASAHPAP